MKFASLFTGIGGFDLGFERVGMMCVAQVEIDKAAQTVLRRHFPNAQLCSDITTVSGSDLGSSVELLSGGFPCQDVSLAGRRAGLAGERSGLWYHFHRLIFEVQPQFVVIENVPGLLSSNQGRDMLAVLQGLADIGYFSAWRVLDSQYFGVAQRRRRVFIVASLGDGRAAQVLFERESGGGHSAPGRQAWHSSTDRAENVAGTVSAKWAKGSGVPAGDECYNLVVGTLLSNGAGTRRPGGNRNEASYIIADAQQAPRRLTPTECERLQGFPDGWTAGQSDSARYRQLGNAVTVNVAEWIGRRLMEVAR